MPQPKIGKIGKAFFQALPGHEKSTSTIGPRKQGSWQDRHQNGSERKLAFWQFLKDLIHAGP